MRFAAQVTDEQRDMNKAVGPAPEPFSGAGGAGAVPPCSYLTTQPRYCPTKETGDNLRRPACDTDNEDFIPLNPIRRRAKLHPDLVATLGIHYFGRPEAAQPPTATAEPAPYLVFKQSQAGVHGAVQSIALTKCRCYSSWCPSCFKSRGSKVIARRLRSMAWRKVRHIMLSVERSHYTDGQTAYLAIVKGGLIRGMLRNLKRILGKEIVRWLWVLEWHEDGFPHWHVIVEMAEDGRAAMLGYDAIQRYWGQGIVHESYVKNESHWKALAGYFGQTGYFEESKKDYQTGLPEWAKDSQTSIRRFGASAGKWSDSGKRSDKRSTKEADEKEKKLPRRHRSYRVIMDGCGKETRVRLYDKNGNLRNCWMASVSVYGAVHALKDIKRNVSEIEKKTNGLTVNVPHNQWLQIYPGKEAVQCSVSRRIVPATGETGFQFVEGVGYVMNVDSGGLRDVMGYLRDNGLRKAPTRERLLFGQVCN